jgi:hypothetical protein
MNPDKDMDELATKISDEIARSIDQQFLSDIMIACGWTPVEIATEQRQNYDSVTGTLRCWQWAVREFGSPGQRWQWDTNQTFVFRDGADAVYFSLKWS